MRARWTKPKKFSISVPNPPVQRYLLLSGPPPTPPGASDYMNRVVMDRLQDTLSIL
jgi:hypothetical protein